MESPESSAVVMPSLEKRMLMPSSAESADVPETAALEADASEALYRCESAVYFLHKFFTSCLSSAGRPLETSRLPFRHRMESSSSFSRVVSFSVTR